MTGYCEPEDVRAVLQDDLPQTEPREIEAAIEGLTPWVREKTRRHFYDSAGDPADLVDTEDRVAAGVRLDVPSSPHATGRQLHRGERGARYPVTDAGPYARIRLPHFSVESLTSLEVRDRDGDVADWETDPEFTEGRGEDYYLHVDRDETRASFLFIRAAAIGSRINYDDLLTLEYRYGRDQAEDDWTTVRNAVAHLAAADLVLDEDVATAVPNDGQLVATGTKADEYLDAGLTRLKPYLALPTA
jgi:hypothetical protein